jgi:hypothetical protein
MDREVAVCSIDVVSTYFGFPARGAAGNSAGRLLDRIRALLRQLKVLHSPTDHAESFKIVIVCTIQ